MKLLSLILVGLLSLPALAQADAPLRRLLSADEAKDWQAVGRLNIQGAGFCTGSLIDDNLVLTAAHCVFHRKSKKIIAPDRIHFLAGWRKGWAAAHRRARRVVVHPDYDFQGSDRLSRVATDLALIELESPIRASVVKPFERYKRPRPGDPVSVVSYAKERSEVPSLQEPCHMLGRQSDVLVLSCDVNFGASGSPIFVVKDGEPRIAAVVSAMAQWNNRDVALGTSLGTPLENLMLALQEADPVFRSVKPGQAVSGLPQVDVKDAAGPETSSARKVIVPPKD